MAKSRAKKVAIGIDLGTTKCCVGVVRGGKVEIIENERANKTTPSYVAFTDTDRLVGEDAKDQATLNPANTIFGVKKMIGRNFDQATRYCSENHLSFDVVEEEWSPRFRVNYKGEEHCLTPEQVSSMLLSKMKQLAESFLGCPVTDAVVSVPAYFNNAQKRATKVAAKIAGLNVLKLIKEPTAAAITFASNRRSKEKETIVMVDIGGGFFDAVVLVVDKGFVEVKSIKGDCHFGGQNLDTLLLNHFADEFQRKYGRDLREVKRATERLRAACTKVKHTLSLLPKTTHLVECLLDDIDFNLDITRETFDELFTQSVTDTMEPVLDLLRCNHINVDHVVVVGGSIRVPKLQTFLKEYFQKDLMKTVNADEAVAYGAAYHAAILSGGSNLPDIRVSDLIAPHSIEAIPTHNSSVILSSRLSKSFGNSNQKSVPFDSWITFNEFVHYRDESKTEYNYLGRTFPDAGSNETKTTQQFEIDYGVDSDGLFYAPGSKKRAETNLKPFWKPYFVKVTRPIELKRMEDQHGKFEDDFQKRQAQIHAYSELECLCFETKQKLSEHRELLTDERERAVEKCDELLDWLEMDAEAELAEIQRRRGELVELVSPLIKQQ